MKLRVIVCAILAMAISHQVYGAEIKVAVTTSFHNSGLSDVLLPRVKSDLDLDVQLLVVGTGQALRLGQSGDVDAILVHSRKAEDAFVRDGYGSHRREIMFNDFVLIGPSNDPANVNTAQTAAGAMHLIATQQSTFVSRGDDSGTHKKELSLWSAAGVDSEISGNWYRQVGSGMGATLNTASSMNAYVLSDRASWIKFGNKGDLKNLFSGDPILFNQYAFLPVNPALHPHVKADLALALENWLASDASAKLISEYQVGGQTLFTFNAKPAP